MRYNAAVGDGRFSRRALLAGAAAGAVGWRLLLRRRRRSIRGVRLSDRAGLIRSLAFASDGRHLISGGADDPPLLRIWNLQERKLARWFTAPGPVRRLDIHREDALLAVGGMAPGWTSYVVLFDWRSGRLVRELEHSRYGSLDGVWFAANDTLITSSSSRGEQWRSRLWDVASGAPLHELLRHADAVSSDGRTVLSGGVLWDLASERVKAEAPRRSSGWSSVWGAALSPDGSRAISQKGSGFLWNARGEMVRPFDDQPGWLWDAAFSSDDRFLLTASEPGLFARPDRLVLRDGRTGEPLAECRGHGAKVLAVAFAPDGRMAASADRSGGLYLWTMPGT